MKGFDPEGQTGPKKPLPDSVQIADPPVDKVVAEPTSDHREAAAVVAPPPPAEEPVYQQDAGFDQPADGYQGPPAF